MARLTLDLPQDLIVELEKRAGKSDKSIQMGQLTHVGKRAVFGLGRYRMEPA